MTEIEANIERSTETILRHCGPIFVAPSTTSYPNEMVCNGTYALVDTGAKHLLVTCCHVWDAFVENHDVNPGTVLAVTLADGPAVISFRNPERQCLGLNRDLDLVVFDFSPNTIPVPCEKSWFRISEWPMSMPQPGDYILTLGFPGAWRKTLGMECKFGCVAIPLKVSAVSDRTIAVFADEENREVLTDMQNCWGGISGSPAYRLDGSGKLQLAGFVKAGPKERAAGDQLDQTRTSSLLAGGIYLTRADFLQPDGTLGRQGVSQPSRDIGDSLR